MNKLALAGATLAVLVCAAVASAASLSPSTDPGATSELSATPGAVASPATGSTSSAGQSAAKTLPSWTAQVAPVDI